MSLCQKGLDVKLKDTAVTTVVSVTEPLVALANTLAWPRIAGLAIPDLKRTAKGCWYLGRRLSLRSHLAVMILQSLLKETDRGIEQRIKQTPLLQVFCGKSVLPDWRCGDSHEDRGTAQPPLPRDAPGHRPLCGSSRHPGRVCRLRVDGH